MKQTTSGLAGPLSAFISRWFANLTMVGNHSSLKSSAPVYVVDSSEDEYEQYPESYPLIGLYDRPLPCCGCGVGWFSVIIGFVFPLAWYYGAFLYLSNYYEYDPRERSGLAAAAVMALLLSMVIIIVLLVVFLA